MGKTKKQKKTYLKWFMRAISLLAGASGILFFFMTIRLSLIPLRYLIIIWTVLLVILGIPSKYLWDKRQKKGLSLIWRGILYLIFLIIFGTGIYYLNDTYHFLDNIRAENYQTETYYVVVKKSNLKMLSDISMVGFASSSLVGEEEAKEQLQRKVAIEFKDYKDSWSMVNSLLDNQVEAIFLNSNTHDIIKDENSIYRDETNIIETIDISVQTDDVKNEVDVVNEAFHIYISGIDTYGSINNVSRSDVNMIATVNPQKNQILLTSIPRDYYVQLSGTKGYKDKLTHAGIYGVQKSISTIEELFDIEINYYVRVNFTTLIELVDALGGIEIDSDRSFVAWTNSSCSFKKGKQKVNGMCALAFSRERYAYQEGDRHRVQNQQQVLSAIISKLTSSTTLIMKYSSILDTLEQSFQTNMDPKQISSLIHYQLDEMPKWKFEMQSVDGVGSSNYTYSIPSTKLYVMIPDMDIVKSASKKMNEIVNN